MRALRVGVVGVGHLGQAHARILAGLPGVQLVGIVDTNTARAEEIAQRHGVRVFDHHLDLAPQVDAVCVVTPTVFHHPVAADLLKRRVALLVEKPLALNLAEADELAELSDRYQTILQVGHIERFNPAYEELRRRPITPKFVEAERHGTFTGRSTDIGAVMDLMIHDLDLLLDLVGEPVVEVNALGVTVFGRHEDMASVQLRFAGGCVAHLTASRMSPRPKRKLRVWAPEGYAGIDFCDRRLSLVQPSPQVRERGLNARGLSPEQRRELQGEVFTRYLQSQELTCHAAEDQLTAELKDFLKCVRTSSRPRVDAAAGRDAVALAERIITSLRDHAWGGDFHGPDDLPPPRGVLFDAALPDLPRRAAA